MRYFQDSSDGYALENGQSRRSGNLRTPVNADNVANALALWQRFVSAE